MRVLASSDLCLHAHDVMPLAHLIMVYTDCARFVTVPELITEPNRVSVNAILQLLDRFMCVLRRLVWWRVHQNVVSKWSTCHFRCITEWDWDRD